MKDQEYVTSYFAQGDGVEQRDANLWGEDGRCHHCGEDIMLISNKV